MSSVMEAVTYCKVPSCRHVITVFDVIREKDVRGDPTHIVVLFKCPSCGTTDRVVPTRERWEEKFQSTLVEQRRQDKIIKAFEIDMGLFDTVPELIALWNSFRYPPPLERGKK